MSSPSSLPRRPVGRVRVRVAAASTAAALLFVVTACNDDGRELRPSRLDQVGSVSTTAPPTVDTAGLISDLPAFETSPTSIVSASTTTAAPPMSLQADFVDGGPIDIRHTCDGENVSPALSWTPAPAGTLEIAITMTDLDAPEVVHWTFAGIDPATTSLAEAFPPDAGVQGLAYDGELGYRGPCPSAGSTHTYEFRVHFLAQSVELGTGSLGADLIAAIGGSAFASAAVTGTYSRA
jgi:Raf kinase inhibitor-like YbhB/YbcL family protein